MSEQTEKKILTREQVKEKLNISTGTLYNWEKAEILKPTRIGRRVYFLERDIMEFFEK